MSVEKISELYFCSQDGLTASTTRPSPIPLLAPTIKIEFEAVITVVISGRVAKRKAVE